METAKKKINIVIKQKVLADALSEVYAFVPTKTSIEALKFVRITTKGNRMKLEANNEETGIARYVELLTSSEDGSFCIDGRSVCDFVMRTKCDEIMMDVEDDKLVLTHKDGFVTYPAMSAAYYPSFKVDDKSVAEAEFPSDVLVRMIMRARNFISDKDVRPQLCAIYASVNEGALEYCATDMHSIAMGTEPLPEELVAPQGMSFFTMPGAFASLVNLLKKFPTCRVRVSKKSVTFRAGDTLIFTRQPVGAYPEYKRIIPKDNKIECSVSALDLRNAVMRLSLICEGNNYAVVDIDRTSMGIEAFDFISGRKAVEHLNHYGCSGEIRIGVNIKNLISALPIFKDSDIEIYLDSPQRPFTIMSDDVKGFRIMLTPMVDKGND